MAADGSVPAPAAGATAAWPLPPRAILAAFAIALAVRVAAVVWLGSFSVPAADDHFAFGFEIGRIARGLAEGRGYLSPFGSGEPTAWMPPLYPFLVAFVFSLFGVYSSASAVVLLALQSVLGALTVPVGFALGRRWLGERAGRLAAFALALYPAAVYFSAGMVWPSSLTVLLILSVLLLAAIHRAGGAAPVALAGGLLLGLAALADPTCLVLAAALLWSIARAPGRWWPERLRATALATLACLLLLLPWLARNRLAFGEWVFLKSNFGNELWLGNNDHATGHWLDADGRFMVEHLGAAERERIDRLGEPELNRYFLERALDWMAAHPERVAQLTVRRIAWFWWRVDFPSVRARGEAGGGRMALALLTLSLRAVVLLAAVGLLLALVRRRPVAGGVLFLALYPLGYYLTHVSMYRYRFPVEPVLVLFAAAAVAELPRLAARLRTRPQAPDGRR